MLTTEQTTGLLQYGQLVQIAYAVFKEGNLNPPQKDYPNGLQGYELLYNIQMNDFFWKISIPEYYGFIARSLQEPDEIVVVFRGTETAAEWWDDLHYKQVPFLDGDYGNVEEGFYDIYKTITLNNPVSGETGVLLTETIHNNTLIPELGSIPLVIAGHSLGGALATLYAAHHASANYTASLLVYSYASPKVGDITFADFYNKEVTGSYRVFNEPDLVPMFPGTADYVPVEGGIEINSLSNPAIATTVLCFHALGTYLCMLGAGTSVLGNCLKQNNAAAAG